MKKRILIFLTAVLLILSALALPLGALTLTYTPTNAYKSSIFYERLRSVKLTGDQRRDIVNVAISQLGYHEGNSRADFGGLNYSGTGNYVEYNHANRETLDGGGSYYWCASFVTFCARQAGIPTSTVINSVSCDNFVVSFKKASRYKTRSSGYKPIAGDLIFFLYADSDRTYASHVGIVVGVKGGKVYTVEGNTTRDMVNYRSYSLTNANIAGYGVPAYKGTTGNYSDIELKTGYVEPGLYKVDSESLNLRAAPTSSSSLVGTVKRSTVFYISEADGDWGKTVHNGKAVWVSLKYLLPSDLSDYRITYKVNGEESRVDTVRAGSRIAVKNITTAPTGYEFLGWSSLKDSSKVEYRPEDILTASSDLTLYAVLQAKPVTVRFFDDDGRLISSKVYKYGDKISEPDAPKKESDEDFEYIFDGWDKPIIKTARADRDYRAIYRAVKPETESTTTFTDVIESVFDIFSSDGAKAEDTPEQGSASDLETPDKSTDISPTRVADTVTLFIFAVVTTLILFIKKKQ